MKPPTVYTKPKKPNISEASETAREIYTSIRNVQRPMLIFSMFLLLISC
jgi:hypothetical protein